MKTTVHLLLYLLLTIAVGCTNPSDSSQHTPQTFNSTPNFKELGIAQTKIEAIDSLLQSYVDEQKLNCVAGFVAQRGNVLYHKAFGWKDVENRIPASIDDYYILFSQTKAVTTVAFMTLVIH